MNVARIGIVGTGLIGASIGLAARAAGAHVTGWDADAEALRVAGRRRAVEPVGSMAEAVRDADLAIVATPVATLPTARRRSLT
jgi:prephenate dehydrogenase